MARHNRFRAEYQCLLITIACMFCSLAVTSATSAEDATPAVQHRVTFFDDRFPNDKPKSRTVECRVLIAAQDGGLLIEGRDGRLWTIGPKQLKKDEATTEPFRPFSADEIGQQLQTELIDFGIKSPSAIVQTKHYVICSTAGRVYGEWVGGLFERLHDAFHSFWKEAGLELHEPEFPLAAFALKDQAEFTQVATKHDGPDASVSKGYFSIETNRIVMFDLSNTEKTTQAKSFDEIRRKMRRSPFNVATVIHEATHQIAFNSGMHTRFADNPVWLTEGMAMFFEVPDLESHSGWKTVGKPNQTRLVRFRESLKQQNETHTLPSLIESDSRLKDVAVAEAAYAESWALTYFLIKNRKADYVAYLKNLQNKPRLKADTPETRLGEFRQSFGEDLEILERDFKRWSTWRSK